MIHLFIVNPKSFWNNWKLEQVYAKIRGFFKNAEDYSVVVSRFPRDTIGFINNFVKKYPDDTWFRVYAVGGDGILFDCLNGIMGLPNTQLGFMPYGHSNKFIGGFGPKSKFFFRNMERQLAASVIPLDVIRCDGNYALSFCAVGAEAVAIHNTLKIHRTLEAGSRFTQWLGRKLYNQSYYVGGAPACLNTKLLHQRYEIDIDGEDFSGNYRNIFIANGAFSWGNKHPVSSALPNDGLLDIILARSAGRLRTISLVPFYLWGQYNRFPKDFVMKQGRKVRIRSQEPFLVSCDEVPFYNSEFTIEAIPGAVQFADATNRGYGGGGGGIKCNAKTDRR
jgi:diacylglycerol kinase family enzyme